MPIVPSGGAPGPPGPPGPVGGAAFVFRPGGVAAGNVYTSWPALMAACDALPGPRQIAFDDSLLSPCVVPSGAWLMRDVVWTNGRGTQSSLNVNIGGAMPVVLVQEGAVFTRLRHVSGVEIQWDGLTPPVSDWITYPDVFVCDEGAGIFNTGAATGPFFSVALTDATISLRDGATLFPAGAGGVALAVVTLAGAALTIEGGIGATLTDSAVDGVVGSTLNLTYIASSAVLSEIQPTLGAIVVGSAGSPLGVPLVRLTPRPSLLVDGTTTPFTLQAFAGPNDIMRCDPTALGFDVNLPLAANRGAVVIVKNVSASPNILTIAAAVGDTIDGLGVFNFGVAFGSITVVSDGEINWMIV